MPPLSHPAAPPKTNVLLIGSGAREHSLAWRLAQAPGIGTLFTDSPKNPGLAALCRPADYALKGRDTFAVEYFCQKNRVGLVVIGPEEPLAAGLTDALLGQRFAGEGVILAQPRAGMTPAEAMALTPTTSVMNAAVQYVFGPSKAAALLEADKVFAKDLMRSAAIPTADSRTFTDAAVAREYVLGRTAPLVIKAAGLAKGKGVFLPDSPQDGAAVIDRIMAQREFGDAGKTVLIEERLRGREVSVFALVDGRNILMLEPCQDHKRLRDGAQGPNTGGMGALCPTRALDERTMGRVLREIIVPTIDALRREGIEYKGVLYAGIMLTHGGPKVLEFNVRFGDPECQALMMRFEGDLLEVMLATARGGGGGGNDGTGKGLDTVSVGFTPGVSVTVVLAAPGYPDAPKAGVPITGIEEAERVEGVKVFHAGTALDQQGQLVTAGGRVLSVSAQGTDLEEARRRVYQAADRIHFAGKQMRRDIGTEVVG
ncbi:phosphoribosylamine--glycine ligase [soil metagenome]